MSRIISRQLAIDVDSNDDGEIIITQEADGCIDEATIIVQLNALPDLIQALQQMLRNFGL